MRQRYYNPEIKRFVNQDILTGSIGNSQSLNRYSYVQGNPVSYTDPFGLSPLNGLFSGTMLIHTVCGLLGWIPGPVGAIANIVDGLVYLLVDKDYKNAFYSIGTGLSFGVGKIVGAVGKGSKTALRVQRVCNAVGNGINFAQCAEGTVQMGGMMIDKYIVQGQPFSGSTVKELFLLGAYMFSGSKSGSALATDVKDFGKLVKGSWTARGTDAPFVAKPNQGQGFSSKGYNPQTGERTFEGYVKQNADPEVSLYSSSSGFNNGNGDIGGQFKRFGAEPGHGIDGPHVHQPLRNSAPNGLIFGDVGSKTKNGGVTSPMSKDVKQLYEYLNNGKYHK